LALPCSPIVGTERCARQSKTVFPLRTHFFGPLPAARTDTAQRRERPLREGPPQFSRSGGIGSSLQTFSSADDRTSRAGHPPRSLCHGHDRPGREAQSSRHQPIRYEGSGPHTCRARLGRTKGPARLPAAGNRCCEEDREVFPQTERPGLGENLAHSTSLQAGQVTQRATRLLQSKMRRSPWRGGK
jgi:hypothetical protein